MIAKKRKARTLCYIVYSLSQYHSVSSFQLLLFIELTLWILIVILREYLAKKWIIYFLFIKVPLNVKTGMRNLPTLLLFKKL